MCVSNNVLICTYTAMDDDRQLLLRQTSESPPCYRVRYEGVEIGTISETVNNVTQITFWHWGVDTMPLMNHGGRPPSGQARHEPARRAVTRPPAANAAEIRPRFGPAKMGNGDC